MPPRRAVELRVGGQTYRVVGTEDDQHVQRLAELVDRKHVEVVPQGRGVTPQQAIFLTAMALAQEVEEQRSRVARLEQERDRSLRLATRAREVVSRVLSRVDGALSPVPPNTAVASDNIGARAAAPGPMDQITEPPDAVHEPVMIDLVPPSARDLGNEAGVSRTPRGGLRLVQQASSGSAGARGDGAGPVSWPSYLSKPSQGGLRSETPGSPPDPPDDESH